MNNTNDSNRISNSLRQHWYSHCLLSSVSLIALFPTALAAEQIIGANQTVGIHASNIQDMNCDNVTIKSGGTLNLSTNGTLQEVSTLTIESGGTLNAAGGQILKLAQWVNHGTVTNLPAQLQLTADCGAITIAGSSDTDGDGISDDLEGGTDIDGDNQPDLDVDGDGIYNFLDDDSDGDGINDQIEGIADDDGDTIPNYLDAVDNTHAVSCTTVTHTADTGANSLREAINCANANAGLDTISFTIPTNDPNYDAGTGVWTITLADDLPIITQPIVIDGTTANGASCGDLDNGTPHHIKIALTTSDPDTTNYGLSLRRDGSTVKGLSIYGVKVTDLHIFNSSNHTIQCNYIGIKPDGVSTATTQAHQGLQVFGSTAATNTLIGGTNAGEGNVIGGHSQDGISITAAMASDITLHGNIIGLSADASTAVPNRSGIVVQTDAHTVHVGGTNAGEGNLISGNTQRGVLLNQAGSHSTIQGNKIGTSLDGNSAMPNGDSGIEIVTRNTTNPVSQVLIHKNTVAGNSGSGIQLSGDTTATVALSDITITNNTIGRNVTDTANLTNAASGINVQTAQNVMIGGIGINDGNRIYAAGATSDGVRIVGNTTVASVLGNRIAESTEWGIDIVDPNDIDGGQNNNDAGDTDTGPNNMLNHMVFNHLNADGTPAVAYDFNLDAPANTEGYRIEFYRDNISGDTHGEAHEYLGNLDISHAGGDLNFTGTFTANTAIASTDNLTATVTKKTATGFAETSEFSETRTATTANGLQIQIKALLQGAYSANDGLMRDDLHVAQQLPLTSPYSTWGYTLTGATTLAAPVLSNNNSGNGLVDWVIIELRDKTDPTQITQTVSALLQRDGFVIDPSTGSTTLSLNLPNDDYYVALRHRNHLGVMTANPISLSNHTLSLIDFIDPNLDTWGDHARLINTTLSLLWGGDSNHDGKIIAVGIDNDVNPVLARVLLDSGNLELNANYITTGYDLADINLDNKTIYAGQRNELNWINANNLIHPANHTNSTNFIIEQQLP
ncbi:MAG: beta strand repeat-containing protein [bacterium]